MGTLDTGFICSRDSGVLRTAKRAVFLLATGGDPLFGGRPHKGEESHAEGGGKEVSYPAFAASPDTDSGHGHRTAAFLRALCAQN